MVCTILQCMDLLMGCWTWARFSHRCFGLAFSTLSAPILCRPSCCSSLHRILYPYSIPNMSSLTMPRLSSSQRNSHLLESKLMIIITVNKIRYIVIRCGFDCSCVLDIQLRLELLEHSWVPVGVKSIRIWFPVEVLTGCVVWSEITPWIIVTQI